MKEQVVKFIETLPEEERSVNLLRVLECEYKHLVDETIKRACYWERDEINELIELQRANVLVLKTIQETKKKIANKLLW